MSSTHSSLYAYHQPVLLRRTIERLITKKDGFYVDLTFGGGGHSRAILSELNKKGQLIAFDQDPAAAMEANTIQDPRFSFFQINFKELYAFWNAYQWPPINGLLADLGVSSYQLNEAKRGFAARLEGPLDMRMNPNTPTTAADLLNLSSEKKIANIIHSYGEIKGSIRIARALVSWRKHRQFASISDLKEAIAPLVPLRKGHQFHAKLFQALRIAVNDELIALEKLLWQLPPLTAAQGRIVILAYHSLEDRMVKRFFRTGDPYAVLPKKDFFGHIMRPFDPLLRKVEVASDEEIAQNSRARSAKMRTAIRNEIKHSILL